MGRLALYDHVFVHDEQLPNFYIFSFVDGYETLAGYMVENYYPAHINMTELSSHDMDAYDRAIKASVGDISHVPESWSDEGK